MPNTRSALGFVLDDVKDSREYDLLMTLHAEYFNVFRYEGRGRRVVLGRGDTLDEARSVARRTFSEEKSSLNMNARLRPVAIYAVTPVNGAYHSTHVENVYKKERDRG
jgi:hypothetical protein